MSSSARDEKNRVDSVLKQDDRGVSELFTCSSSSETEN